MLHEEVVDHRGTPNSSDDSFLQISVSPPLSFSNLSLSSFHLDDHNLSGDDGDEESNGTGAISVPSESDSDESEIEESFNKGNSNEVTVLQVDLIEQVKSLAQGLWSYEVCNKFDRTTVHFWNYFRPARYLTSGATKFNQHNCGTDEHAKSVRSAHF